MATHLDADLIELQMRVGHFAEAEVLSRLSADDAFPMDLWQKMGEAELLGLGLPTGYGGSGGSWLTIQAAGEAFVRGSHNVGMALSWLIHLIVARFAILGFGTAKQIETWMPGLACGVVTASLAISEPKTGAHPKHLRTSATREGDHWVLNGEKTLLTNGPLAGLFVILAVSAVEGDKKRLTAFLVPKETPGLSLTEAIPLDILKPSPHCGIRLNHCAVSSAQILGEPGAAFEKISKPFRTLEDVLLMGPVVGGLAAQLMSLITLIQRQSIARTDILKMALGALQVQLDALRILAYEAVVMLDSGRTHPEFQQILLSFRSLAKYFQSCVKRWVDQHGIKTEEPFTRLTNDLNFTIRLAENIAQLKQKILGEALLP
jgi:alkylation response protein AidB-like acyl-CoA dehydrogenase